MQELTLNPNKSREGTSNVSTQFRFILANNLFVVTC